MAREPNLGWGLPPGVTDRDIDEASPGYWDEPEGEDVDVDVCLGCGRYYGMSPSLEQAWRSSVNYREGAVMDQLCLRCMEGHPPPHEF